MNALEKIALKSISLMDLTSLNQDDKNESIIELCRAAKTKFTNTAAICIYSQFIAIAKQQLIDQNTPDIKIATVVNFPHGESDITRAVQETVSAIEAGADEIDLVFPYKALLNGNESIGFDMVKAVKVACANKRLKVIIETGELKTEVLIRRASELSINAGADFIKTSTGKVPVNATLESSRIMLEVIKHHDRGSEIGFKPAGGVKTVEDAKQYIEMVTEIMGADWLNSEKFRFGASSLLNHLLLTLGEQVNAQHKGY